MDNMAYTLFLLILGIFMVKFVTSQSHDIDCYCVNKHNVTYLVHCSDGAPCSWQLCSCAATITKFVCAGCECSCTYERELKQRSNILQCRTESRKFKCRPATACSKPRQDLFRANIAVGQGGRMPFDAIRLSVDPEDINDILRYRTITVHEERVIAALKISPFLYNMTHKLQCLSDFLETCPDGILTKECPPELTLQDSNSAAVSVLPVTKDMKDEPTTSYGIGAVLGAFIGGAALTFVIGLAILLLYRRRTSTDQGRNAAPEENTQGGHDYSDISAINFRPVARPVVPQAKASTSTELADHGNFSRVSPPDLPSNPFPRIGNMYHNTGTSDSCITDSGEKDNPGYDFISPGNGIEAADDVDYTTLQMPAARAKELEIDRKPCGSTGNENDEEELEIRTDDNQFREDKSGNEEISDDPKPDGLDNNGYFLLENK